MVQHPSDPVDVVDVGARGDRDIEFNECVHCFRGDLDDGDFGNMFPYGGPGGQCELQRSVVRCAVVQHLIDWSNRLYRKQQLDFWYDDGYQVCRRAFHDYGNLLMDCAAGSLRGGCACRWRWWWWWKSPSWWWWRRWLCRGIQLRGHGGKHLRRRRWCWRFRW